MSFWFWFWYYDLSVQVILIWNHFLVVWFWLLFEIIVIYPQHCYFHTERVGPWNIIVTSTFASQLAKKVELSLLVYLYLTSTWCVLIWTCVIQMKISAAGLLSVWRWYTDIQLIAVMATLTAAMHTSYVQAINGDRNLTEIWTLLGLTFRRWCNCVRTDRCLNQSVEHWRSQGLYLGRGGSWDSQKYHEFGEVGVDWGWGACASCRFRIWFLGRPRAHPTYNPGYATAVEYNRLFRRTLHRHAADVATNPRCMASPLRSW